MNGVQNQERRNVPLWPLALIIIIVVGIWGGYWYWLEYYHISYCDANTQAIRGQFGDMFGGVNALFTALAFAVLIYTMWLQRVELRRQGEDMTAALRLNALVSRRDLFLSMYARVNAESVHAMMLHPFEHFDMDNFHREYEGHPDRIKSYLIMKQKYLYLFTTYNIEMASGDPPSYARDLWLRELCQYREFREVHASQGRYYGPFEKHVENIIAATPLKGWALYACHVEPDAAPTSGISSLPASVSTGRSAQQNATPDAGRTARPGDS